MSNDTRTHVGSIMTALTGLGYEHTDDMFSFDEVPTSKMDKAYRIEVETDGIVEVSGQRVEKAKKVDVWTAYRLTAKGDREDAFLDALDSQEALEDELLGTLTTLPSIVLDGVMALYKQNYFVVHITMSFTYWRDLT